MEEPPAESPAPSPEAALMADVGTYDIKAELHAAALDDPELWGGFEPPVGAHSGAAARASRNGVRAAPRPRSAAAPTHKTVHLPASALRRSGARPEDSPPSRRGCRAPATPTSASRLLPQTLTPIQTEADKGPEASGEVGASAAAVHDEMANVAGDEDHVQVDPSAEQRLEQVVLLSAGARRQSGTSSSWGRKTRSLSATPRHKSNGMAMMHGQPATVDFEPSHGKEGKPEVPEHPLERQDSPSTSSRDHAQQSKWAMMEADLWRTLEEEQAGGSFVSTARRPRS